MRSRAREVFYELRDHLPFALFSTAAGIALVGFLSAVALLLSAKDLLPEACHDLFHIFHPIHMLFSALATTAMFWRHERHLVKAVVIGFVGAVGICGVSDIVMPFASGLILGAKMSLHICVLEHPSFVIPFAVTGIFAGLIVPAKTNIGTISSHSAHVLVSSAASLLYLISFGMTDWIGSIGYVFLFMVLSVLLPCCFSDIIFPLLFAEPHPHLHEAMGKQNH